MNQDFQDFLRELSDAGARFLIVGAYALAAHGLPRATGDIDIWVEPTMENAGLVFRALQAFGAPLHDLTVADLGSPGVVFQMGLPPRRIDVLTQITGVDFDEAWARRAGATFGDLEVWVIGPRELLRNKRATGRPRDLVDAATIVQLLDLDER